MRNKTLTALSIIGFAFVVSAQAKAQNIEHSLQLGLGTNFLTYESGTITQNQPQPDGSTLEYKTVDQTTTWGFSSRNPLSLEAGYGITDSLVIGGMLQLGGWANTIGAQNVTAAGGRQHESRFSLFIGPKLDFMLLPDSMVRPFVGGAIGLVRRTDTIETTNQNNITTTQSDLGQTGIGLMARAGIRWFLTPGFSIDPAFMFGFGWTSGGIDVPAGAGATRNIDTSANGYTVGLSVAFSGWVGL
jgi:hypothetical protein